MDNLTPPLLVAIREIRWHLLGGRSIKESINAYLRAHHDEFAVRLHELWSLKIQGHIAVGSAQFAGHRAQALWELIERAYQGQPILEPLGLLEDDVEATAISDLEMHVATLPFKALAPLLLLQFPAFAMLLIGPLLRELARYSLAVGMVAMAASMATEANAEALSSAALRRISKTKRVTDLDQIKRAFDELRVLRMACDLQLKERTVPSTCYQALLLEQKWGLSSAAHALKVRARIDRRCMEAAGRFQGLESDLSGAVSAICRTSVARAKELKDYQQSENENWRGS